MSRNSSSAASAAAASAADSSSPAAPPRPLCCSQLELTLAARPRGCHLITADVLKALRSSLAAYSCGTLHLFIQHTSASLSINENADSDVRADMESWLNAAVSERTQWLHDAEGADDMPAHVKSSVLGCSVTLPISRGALNLGTWQGIWLGEHRDRGGPRKLVATITGAMA